MDEPSHSPEQPLTDPDAWWNEYEYAYQDRSWQNYRRLLAEYIRHGCGGMLVDIGTGYGFLVECARRFGVPAVGLDASNQALAGGRELHPHIDLRLWRGGEPLPFGDSTIGGAIVSEFVDHIPVDQVKMMFDELHRILAPSGVVLVQSPSRFDLATHASDKGHVSFFSPSEFAALVTASGFQIVDQPFVPLPVAGTSPLGKLVTRCITRFYKPEKWSSRIDLVARKVDPASLPA